MKSTTKKTSKKQTSKVSHTSILPANEDKIILPSEVHIELPDEPKGSRRYQRFDLKAKVLRTLLLSDIAMTCRELNDAISYKGNYASFRVQIYKYVKKGYISSTSPKKPRRYSLTDYGVMNARDVYLPVRDKQRRAQERAMTAYQSLLENDRRFMAEVERVAAGKSPILPEIEHIASPSPTISHEASPKYTEGSDIELINQINQLKQQVQDLTIENHKLKIATVSSTPHVEGKVSKNFQKNEKRYYVMTQFLEKQLRSKFFNLQEVPFYPYKVIASSNVRELMGYKIKGGEIAIYDDRTAAEMLQKGLIRKLIPKEIELCGFVLLRHPDGLYVVSKGIPAKKILDSKHIPKKPEKGVRIVSTDSIVL